MVRPIAMLSYDYPPNDGGISRLTAALVEELAERGRDVQVLTLKAGGAAGPARPGVLTHAVARGKFSGAWATLRYLRQLDTSTMVVCSVWNPECTLAWMASRRSIVVMAHGNEVMAYPKVLRYAFKRWLRGRVLRAAQVVVCNSRYTEGLVKQIHPQARTAIMTPGVDLQRFRPTTKRDSLRTEFGLRPDKRVILSVSRIDAYKGHDVMLRGLAALHPEQRQQLHYVVAGKGAHLQTLKTLALSLGVSDCVTWLGYVDEAKLPGLYACADLFVLCTKEDPQSRGVEGFGMVFLEAQASGVPVIGTRAGGIPDAIIEGEGGWLVGQDDIAAVTAHLSQLVDSPVAYAEQGDRGRERACRDGSWPNYVSKFIAVVDEVHE